MEDSDEETSASKLYGVELTSSQIADPYCPLSTQQTDAFLANFEDYSDFPDYDSKFEEVLMQAESSVSTTTVAKTTTTSTLRRIYESPKGKDSVKAARVNSIPMKTRDQTSWAVRVWREWAIARNATFFADEKSFSPEFRELTVHV